MTDKVFCIGNGESRNAFDLNKLKPHGKIYGCNALYRDFKPDYLVSGDAGVIKEICAKGYPKENKCIFPDWSPVTRDFIDMIVEPMRNDGYSVEESNRDNHKYVQIFALFC